MRTITTVPHTADLAWMSDPEDPRFKQAMKNICEVCDAKRGRPCWNTIDDAAPLPGRLIHYARLLPKGQGKEQD